MIRKTNLYTKTINIALITLAIGAGNLEANAQKKANTQQQMVKEPANSPADWSRAYQPFRIAGDLYYVGTYDLACYLIHTPKGNILINTGLANSAAQIKANVEKLGFKYADIKILLTTQAHYDHMGAMAAIQKETGAKVMVDAADAQVMLDGGSSDYALGGDGMSYEPLKADRLLKDGDLVELGGYKLKILHHPGHTKGSCSFIFDTKDKQRSYKVLIANMPTIVTQQRFADVKSYPTLANDLAYSLKAMKNLSFDIWVASHASQFGLHTKHKEGAAYQPKAFEDQAGYLKALANLQEQYDKKLAQQ